MLRIALKYGLIAAAVMIAVIIVPFPFQDLDTLAERSKLSELIGYSTMLLSMGLVLLAVREVRDRQHGGTIGFGQALSAGLAVTVIAATLFGVATILLYLWLGPERTDAFMQMYVRQSVGDPADAEAVRQALAEYEANRALWLNPAFQGLLMFSTLLPMGVLMSLLAAAFLRRRKGAVPVGDDVR